MNYMFSEQKGDEITIFGYKDWTLKTISNSTQIG